MVDQTKKALHDDPVCGSESKLDCGTVMAPNLFVSGLCQVDPGARYVLTFAPSAIPTCVQLLATVGTA